MLNAEELQSSSGIAEKTNDFKPAGDDFLNGYLEELDEPKQEFEQPIIPEDEPEDLENEIETPPEIPAHQHKTSSQTAFFVVQKVDQLLSTGIAVYAHSKTPSEFQAAPQEIKEIADPLADYFAENAFDLPPWIMALIPAIMLLSKKFQMAAPLRQANMARAKSEKENAQLKAEIETLKQQKEKETLEKEVSELKKQTQNKES